MKEILKNVQVNMPFGQLVEQYLPFVLKERINPEIGLDCFVLDRYSNEEFRKVARALCDAGLSITFHAPFYDLRPGALDHRIREVTIERLERVFELVPWFKPKSVVCHAAFDERYYISHEMEWVENSKETWNRFVGLAEEMDTIVSLENVYEYTPEYLGLLLDAFSDNPHLALCFDTGHCNAFSGTSMEAWMGSVGHHIGQIHLHDNNGSTDSHLPVGSGTFPFYDFFDLLRDRDRNPIITLEPHSEGDLWRSLRNIVSMKLLCD